MLFFSSELKYYFDWSIYSCISIAYTNNLEWIKPNSPLHQNQNSKSPNVTVVWRLFIDEIWKWTYTKMEKKVRNYKKKNSKKNSVFHKNQICNIIFFDKSLRERGENTGKAIQFKQQMHDESMQVAGVQHQKHWYTFKSNENHQLNFEPFCGLLTINICIDGHL